MTARTANFVVVSASEKITVHNVSVMFTSNSVFSVALKKSKMEYSSGDIGPYVFLV